MTNAFLKIKILSLSLAFLLLLPGVKGEGNSQSCAELATKCKVSNESARCGVVLDAAGVEKSRHRSLCLFADGDSPGPRETKCDNYAVKFRIKGICQK